MNEISDSLITARKLLSKIEQINANPEMNGKDNLIMALIDLDMVVQAMLFKMDIRVEHHGLE